MVEVGPGLGVLTRRLLAAGASVIAVELDPRLAEYLRRELGGIDRFELIEADALCLHPRELRVEPFKVVANIPYHITSPLLHAVLEGDQPPQLTVLLVQLEVAERVAAPPGGMSYLSVFVQNVAVAEVVARVPAAAFEPAPAVDSAVLRLSPSRSTCARGTRPGAVLSRRAGRVPSAPQAGAQRPQPGAAGRSDAVEAALASCGVTPDRRPQTLTIDEWACLTGRLAPPL